MQADAARLRIFGGDLAQALPTRNRLTRNSVANLLSSAGYLVISFNRVHIHFLYYRLHVAALPRLDAPRIYLDRFHIRFRFCLLASATGSITSRPWIENRDRLHFVASVGIQYALTHPVGDSLRRQ